MEVKWEVRDIMAGRKLASREFGDGFMLALDDKTYMVVSDAGIVHKKGAKGIIADYLNDNEFFPAELSVSEFFRYPENRFPIEGPKFGNPCSEIVLDTPPAEGKPSFKDEPRINFYSEKFTYDLCDGPNRVDLAVIGAAFDKWEAETEKHAKSLGYTERLPDDGFYQEGPFLMRMMTWRMP